MTGKTKIEKTAEGFRASYEDGPLNQFGLGTTKEEAVAALEKKNIARAANIEVPEKVTGTVSVADSIGIVTDKIIQREIKPFTHDGVLKSWVAYRESTPEKQGYGVDKIKAKAALLQQELEEKNKEV